MTETVPIRIDIASDIVCPWCVIGWQQLERAMAVTGTPTQVHWHPFELNPAMGPEGENLRAHIAAKYGTDPTDSAKARAKLTALGQDLGFRFDYFDEMRMVNTFAAHRLLAWAEPQGFEHALKLALFAAYFSERKDVSDPETLADVAHAVGLDRTQAAAVLASDQYSGEVRAKERMWAEHGVNGVPAMVFQRRHLVTGAQGVENYAAILRQLSGRSAA